MAAPENFEGWMTSEGCYGKLPRRLLRGRLLRTGAKKSCSLDKLSEIFSPGSVYGESTGCNPFVMDVKNSREMRIFRLDR